MAFDNFRQNSPNMAALPCIPSSYMTAEFFLWRPWAWQLSCDIVTHGVAHKNARTQEARTWRPSRLRHLVPLILAIINRAINFDFSSSWVINSIVVHVGVERMDMSYRFSWLLRRVMFIQCGSKTNSHSLWRRFQCAACLTSCSCFPCFFHFQWFNRCRISNELIEKTLPSWFTALVEMLRTWF